MSTSQPSRVTKREMAMDEFIEDIEALSPEVIAAAARSGIYLPWASAISDGAGRKR